MKILGIDFETQSDVAQLTNPTEVGAGLVELDHIDGKQITYPLKRLSELLWEPHYPKQTQEIVSLTGITDEMLEKDGKQVREIFENALIPMIEEADIVMAHNKSFDQTVFESTCERVGLTPPKARWICTLTEVPYPDKYRCRKLSHLSLDHGLKMDGRQLHRAIHDVDLMLELVTTYYSVPEILEYVDIPWAYLRAVIPAPWNDGGVGKAQAQKLGYSWERARGTDAPVFPKLWVKRVKKTLVDQEKKLAPFDVVEVSPS